MIAVSSLSFPGSRTLATWWRQLARHEPKVLAVGYLFLHRLEALARRQEPQKLDPLYLHALRALSLKSASGSVRAAEAEDVIGYLNALLGLGAQPIRHLVGHLRSKKWIEEETGALSELGRGALECGETAEPVWQRLPITFVERLDALGNRRAEPHALFVRDCPAAPWTADAEYPFDRLLIGACVPRGASWKDDFGFPKDVEAVADPLAPEPDAPAWRQVVVDRPERILTALAVTSSGAMLGFGAAVEGWTMQAERPIFQLAPGAAQELDLLPPGAADTWLRAWQSWCESRRLNGEDAQACALELTGEVLRIRPPARLADQLTSGKNDLTKADTWLLAGEGLIRQAARLELVR